MLTISLQLNSYQIHFIQWFYENGRSKDNIYAIKPTILRQKEEIWPSSMTKAPTPTELSKGQSYNTNNATKSSIKQQLRTDLGRSVKVTTGNPTGVVNLVYGPTFPLPRNSRVIKRTHMWKFVNKPPYIDNKPTATPSGEVIKINTQTT